MTFTSLWRIIGSLALVSGLLLPLGSSVLAAEKQDPGPITVDHPVKVDRSPALRSLRETSSAGKTDQQKTIPLGELAKRNAGASAQAESESFTPDAALQLATAENAAPNPDSMPSASNMPAPLFDFEGISNRYNVAPPDPSGAIGPNHYVQWVNLSIQVWQIDRAAGTAVSVLGPVAGNTLWKGFGGYCETLNSGDPVVLYDALANRWLMSQFAIGSVNYQCIAISVTSDPTGEWYRYAYDWGSKMNDYPKFGVWPDGYYMTVNQFDRSNPSNDWQGAGVAVFQRSKMLIGAQASMQRVDLFNINAAFGGMLPADLDGSPPPVGSPAYFMEIDDSSVQLGAVDEMRIWQFHTDWENPANSSFGRSANPGQPNVVLPVANFNLLCPSSTQGCIPQKGTSQKLDPVADRLMQHLTYRYFDGASPYESLIVNHTVDIGPTGSPRAGLRWYEVRKTGGQFNIYQQSTFGGANPVSDTNQRWMGSLSMDWQGNIAVGYSLSSSLIFPSIGYTGRLASDPLNTLGQGEQISFNGAVAQTGTFRWGDYSTLSLDPTDECTFWYTQQYSKGGWSWATRIIAFKMPTCTPLPMGTISGVVTEHADQPVASALVTAGAYSTYTGADGRYTLPRLKTGTYNLNVSKTGYYPQPANGVVVNIDQITTQNFDLSSNIEVQVQVSVTDNDGHPGLPLYASIFVSGAISPDKVIYTDPLTGQATFSLYQNEDYTLTIKAQNYQTAARAVNYASDTANELFGLLTEKQGVCAIGYQNNLFMDEGFESLSFPPDGWSVYQTGDANSGFLPTTSRQFSGGYSVFHNDDDTAALINDFIVSPRVTVPVSGILSFDEMDVWNTFYRYHGLLLTLDSNPDPRVANYIQLKALPAAYPDDTWQHTFVDLSNYAGQSVYLAFKYQGDYSDEWYLDNIRLSTCTPIPGGWLLGYVTSLQSGMPVNQAAIESGPFSYNSTTTADDPNLNDGFYQAFFPSGNAQVSASAVQYGTVSETVAIAPGSSTWHDFALPSGYLTANVAAISMTVLPGSPAQTRVIQLGNDGSSSLSFSALEFNTSTPPVWNPTPAGTFADSHRNVGPKSLYAKDLTGITSYMAPAPGALSTSKPADQWDTGLAFVWGLGYNPDENDVWIGNIDNPDANKHFRFTPEGVNSGNVIDISGWVSRFGGDMAYNPFSRNFWQVNVGGDNCIYELNPRTQAATGQRICAPVGVSQRGLAYDALTKTYYSGSWNDGIIYHFDETGKLLDSRDIGLSIAGLAYNTATGHLFVANNRSAETDIFVLDVNQNYAIVDSFDITGLDGSKFSLDLDCQGRLWTVSGSHVFISEPVESGVCSWEDIPWLSLDPISGIIPAQAGQPLTVTIDPTALEAGYYTAYLLVTANTPNSPISIPVKLNIGYQTYLPNLSLPQNWQPYPEP